MKSTDALADIFWLAFKSLSQKEKKIILERLLKDKEFTEDLVDIAIIEQRRHEPSRPLEDYIAERESRKA